MGQVSELCPSGIDFEIHSLHEFAREHSSDQNSSALVTVWRVVIEKCVTLF